MGDRGKPRKAGDYPDPAENAAEPLTEEEERKLRTRAKYHTLGRDAGSTEREMLGMLATIDALRAEVKRLQAGVEVGTYGIDVAAVLSEELRARPAHEQVDALVIRCNQQQNDLSALRAERDALELSVEEEVEKFLRASTERDLLRARLAAAEEERDLASKERDMAREDLGLKTAHCERQRVAMDRLNARHVKAKKDLRQQTKEKERLKADVERWETEGWRKSVGEVQAAEAERDALRAEVAKLKRIINEDGLECLPGCSSDAHEDLCPYVFPGDAYRAAIAERDAERDEVEKLRKASKADGGLLGFANAQIDKRNAALRTAREAIVQAQSHDGLHCSFCRDWLAAALAAIDEVLGKEERDAE